MARFRDALCACSLLTLAACLLAAPTVAAADDDSGGCQLAAGIKHVIHIQFDNVHLRRDNPDVPSDLEQMPSLLKFLKSEGTLLTNHHTPLISHTADDIITTLTGTYGSAHGQPVANSYGYFRANGTTGFSSSFSYWTDTAPDGAPQMIDQRGKVHPAPWVAFTRAGCDVGAFSTANIEFENVFSDIDNVFGPTSNEHNEAHTNFDKAVADFEGIAVHCARDSRVCGAAGKPDVLNDEPGGYSGFTALYGNANVAPRVNHGSLSVKDLDGNEINDGNNPPNPGFPGFDPSASQTLGYLATMLEAGVPVVYGYIADAHDNHFTFSGSYGPGEAGYVAQLAAYNTSFGKFFARLSEDGITADNTLFIVTADENDHFAGQAGSPKGCDGINTPCSYIRLPAGCDGDTIPCDTTNLGEVDVKLRQLLFSQFNDSTAFSVHSDDAPTVYITGNPSQTAAVTRDLEHNLAKVQAYDNVTNKTVRLMGRMADVAEMNLLHMVTADPARTPTLTFFGNDDFFILAGSATNCESARLQVPLAACSDEQPGFNWNHGDFQDSITRTWLGLVGPHVRRQGATGELFSDHTDIRPTILHLAGLEDKYVHDGRALIEVLDEAIPQLDTLRRLAQAYKAINAPVGELGRKTLVLATHGIESDDATYAAVDARIKSLTDARNTIAAQMIAMLEAATFRHQAIDEAKARSLIEEANQLLASVND
jgi:hypothetical protein